MKTLDSKADPDKVLDINVKPNVSYCIPLELRDQQILINIKKVPGRIQSVDKLMDEPIALVGFGPSLNDTWRDLMKFKYIMTCSGAHKFLVEHGIVPTFHLDLDPRPHKIGMLGAPQKQTQYLIASTIHPTYLDALKGYDVKLWHIFANDDEAFRILPKGEWMLSGGSSVGSRCMTIARFLGFTDLHIFGMDGSMTEANSHTSEHPNRPPKSFVTEYEGKKYLTTPSMLHVAKETFDELDKLGDVKAKFYGSGLIQDMAKNYKPNLRSGSLIAFTKPELISKEYLHLNNKLHQDNPSYGMGGAKHADTVIKIVKSMITPENQFVKVLDYGAGKGMLAKSLPFSIEQYDPAVPEIASVPAPADVVVCTDVLEHIEPDKLTFVLEDLQRVTKRLGFFVISTRLAKKKYDNGQNAHLIVKGKDWWSKTLGKYFDIALITEKDKEQELHVVVGPAKPKVFASYTADVEFEGRQVKFDVPNETIKWRVATIFKKEPITIEWIKSFQAGETMVDIGANMGGYSMLAASKGVKVISFEPEAETYALLQRNTVLNGTDVTAYCAAVTDNPPLDKLYLSQRGAGGSCHSFGQEMGNITQGSIGISLDMMGIKADHIKVDVDGQEPKVIAGCVKMLSGAKSILIEVNTNLREHMEMVGLIQSLGFEYEQSQVDAAIRKDGGFKGCAEFLFRRKQKSETAQEAKAAKPKASHLVKQIQSGVVQGAPFPHMYVRDVFPSAMYKKMVGNFPKEYVEILKSRKTAGYPKRFTAELVGEPWEEVKRIMTDGDLKRTLLKKFGIEDDDFTEDLLLIRDKEQYSITPHTDIHAKVVSALFYLPKEPNVSAGGTYLYEPNEKGFTCKTGKHYKFEDFKSVVRFGLIPNTMLAFARTDDSFHGVEPSDNTRDVLLYNIRRSK